MKVKEQQMFQDYQNRLTQLKNKYNHLSIKYTEPSAWSDWWNKEKWNILFYSSIIIVTIGISYYAYTNLDSITNYIKSIFYIYIIKTPYDYVTDKFYQSYQYIKSFFTFSGKDIPKPDLEDDDDKSIELNYGKSMPELQEAEETEAWRKGKSPNYDGLLNSDSGSDSDSKVKKLTSIFFKSEDESDDSDSTISEHSSTSSSGSSTVKGVNIMDDNVDSDSGSDDDYITPPPSMHNSFRNVAPGISRNTSLMSTSIWGDRLDFSSLDKSMSSMDSTDQWTQSNDTSSSSSDSQNVSSSSSDSQSDSMTSSESKNEGESSNKPLNKNDNNKNNNEQHYVDIY